MNMYRWVSIGSVSDYDELLSLLDSEFDPQKIVPRLKDAISTAVRGVLLEYNYIDKDYRSTFYNFYSKKGRTYRSDCIRLHFFDETVSFNESLLDLSSGDGRLEDHYFGYMVLRPTMVATIGRSILSPNIRKDARGFVIQSQHRVHLLGHRLHLWGFPSMDQHTDIAVCAHVACWSILRHYSERYPQHRELLVHDITMMAHQFDPGGLVPSNGLEINQAERVFQQAGTYPLIVTKTSKMPERFYRQLLAYLESGFPLFVAMHDRGHAVAAIGHSRSSLPITTTSTSSTHAWNQLEAVVVVDDNHLPYTVVPNSGAAAGNYSLSDFDSFIVPLPEKVFYPAEAVDRQSITLGNLLSKFMPMPVGGDLVVRYFVTTLAALRQYMRINQSQLGQVLVNSVMQLQAAQFVWVVEYASLDQWTDGVISARAVLDATASPYDPYPTWFAHGHNEAIFFDRSKADGQALIVPLGRPTAVSIGRMEQNLRPVVARK